LPPKGGFLILKERLSLRELHIWGNKMNEVAVMKAFEDYKELENLQEQNSVLRMNARSRRDAAALLEGRKLFQALRGTIEVYVQGNTLPLGEDEAYATDNEELLSYRVRVSGALAAIQDGNTGVGVTLGGSVMDYAEILDCELSLDFIETAAQQFTIVAREAASFDEKAAKILVAYKAAVPFKEVAAIERQGAELAAQMRDLRKFMRAEGVDTRPHFSLT
jgi:hypothetical protein